MKGTIINVTESEILVRCSEGNKHTAPLSQIKSTDVKPKVGDDVDFEIVEGQATDVYILRAASAVENLTQTATAKAVSAINVVKSHITEENKEKVRHMAANASETVQKLGGELKGKAGRLLNNVQTGDIGSSIKESSFKQLQNKFALFALTLFLVFSFTNIGKLDRLAQFSYHDLTESHILAFFIVGCIVIAGFGLNVIIYRVAVAITLFITLTPLFDLYDLANQGASLGREFGMRAPSFGQLFKEFTTGYIWFFFASFVMTASTLLPGLYKAKQPHPLNVRNEA